MEDAAKNAKLYDRIEKLTVIERNQAQKIMQLIEKIDDVSSFEEQTEFPEEVAMDPEKLKKGRQRERDQLEIFGMKTDVKRSEVPTGKEIITSRWVDKIKVSKFCMLFFTILNAFFFSLDRISFFSELCLFSLTFLKKPFFTKLNT